MRSPEGAGCTTSWLRGMGASSYKGLGKAHLPGPSALLPTQDLVPKANHSYHSAANRKMALMNI